MEKLTEIQSLHEQREMFDNDIIVKKGIWIEVIEFDQITEYADVKHRWEIEKIEEKEEGNLKKYKVTCKILDIKGDEKNKKRMAKKVLDKHSKRLKASFAKCLIEGIETRSIPDLKHALNKLGGKVKSGK